MNFLSNQLATATDTECGCICLKWLNWHAR